jgi:hypothetical protein
MLSDNELRQLLRPWLLLLRTTIALVIMVAAI